MKLNGLFLLIPIIFLVTAIAYIQSAGLYFMGGVDPEYNYLFNGITLAHLKVHLNAIGHPGTPVQILIALVAWTVHLFRPGQTLWDDVMLNPELYIKASLYTANIINAVFLFVLGKQVYRYSKSLIVSLVLQLSPFAFLITLEVSFRLMPELIMTSIISCWLILLVKLLYESPEQSNYKKYSLIFGLLIGFSMAAKLTFLPFFLLPFIIIPGIKLKLRYSVISVLSFAFFAFPAMLNFHKFTGWVNGIFFHKGSYGKGERGIIDWPVFADSLEILLKGTLQLWIPLLATLILALVVKRNKKNDPAVTITLALIAVVIMHYVITAKHFAFYYFVPSMNMAIFSGLLACLLLGKLFPESGRKKVPELLLVIFALVLVISVLPKINKELTWLQERKKMQLEALARVGPFLNNSDHKIICASYYGCSAVEYALLFGLLESGKYKKELTARYNRHYPSSFIYMHTVDQFYNGAFEMEPEDFLKAGVNYTLYIADFSDELLNKVMKVLQTDSTVFRQDIKVLFKSESPAEAVYSFMIVKK